MEVPSFYLLYEYFRSVNELYNNNNLEARSCQIPDGEIRGGNGYGMDIWRFYGRSIDF
jgi:hypothetical protein